MTKCCGRCRLPLRRVVVRASGDHVIYKPARGRFASWRRRATLTSRYGAVAAVYVRRWTLTSKFSEDRPT